ncbi:retrotransposon protein, putative, ty1-copia subclass [Tanacetum coccineum]
MVVRFCLVIIEHVPSGGREGESTMKDSSSFVLENVRYIPELKRNLISLGTLDREGYTVKLQNGRVKVIKGSLMVLSGTMKGNYVYSLDSWAESGEASIGIQEKESLAQVWHKRLGHISEAGLHELEKREVLGNKGLGKLEFCENYVLGKSTRVSFGRGQHTIEEFNNLCKESGIARHLTVTGTPQQNGLAERMNRMLLNKVRCLLIQLCLLESFWAEATVTTTYLINRSPSTALEKKTPMDLWSGHLANYEILWRLDDVKPKIIISMDVVFNESLMYKDTLKGAGAADSRKEVEFGVALQGNRVEPTMDPHTGEIQGMRMRNKDEGNVSFSRPSGSKVDDMATYAFAIAEEEDTHKPITFQEAINSSKKDEWIKEGVEGVQKPRYKARLVAWGFTQRAWIDYNEVFSPVVRHTSIMVILSLTTCEDYELEQLDVKTAFLHGNLEETIYMRQPPGFEEGTGNKVCLLKKSLYGLKQSPRQWYKRFDVYMVINGFSRSSYDNCVYFKEFAPGMYIYLLMYVDDILIACKSKSEIEYTKGLLRKKFDIKELGPARKILGMEIVSDRGSRILKVSQSGYVQKILNNYRVDNGKSISVPLGAHFKVSLKDCPSSDWDVERMSKVPYANAVGLVNGRDQGKHVDVDGFVDADYAKDLDKARSITGYVFMVHGCVVSWKATLQHVVALSTTEAEYMALTEVVKESIWLKGLLIELGRTKHINVRYHFIREIVESKEIEVAKIGTYDNAADAFTKVVPGPKFKYCMEILGVGAN